MSKTKTQNKDVKTDLMARLDRLDKSRKKTEYILAAMGGEEPDPVVNVSSAPVIQGTSTAEDASTATQQGTSTAEGTPTDEAVTALASKAPAPEPDDEVPTETWTDEELILYALDRIDQSRALFVTTAVIKFRLGRALSILQDRLEPNQFSALIASEFGISTSTVKQAIRLYRRAKTEEAVARLSATQALRKFDVVGTTAELDPYDKVRRSLTTFNAALEAVAAVEYPDPERASEIARAILGERDRLEKTAAEITQHAADTVGAREVYQTQKRIADRDK